MPKKPTYDELVQKVRELESNAVDHKNAEALHGESEKILKHAFENANVGVCLVDPDGYFIKVNNRMVEILGYSKEELEKMNVNDVSHPEDITISPEVQRRVKVGKIETTVFQKRYIHKKGHMFWGQVSTSIVNDHEGKPLYFVTHFMDITESKKNEEALRKAHNELESRIKERTAELSEVNEALQESERRFRQLFENMTSGVAVYAPIQDGKNFVFKDINKASEKIDNLSREEVIGKAVTSVFPNIQKFGLFDVFQRVWKTGVPENFPLALYKDDRIEGWRENYILKLPLGEIAAIYDDVTVRKQVEEKLKESQILLSEMTNQVPGVLYQFYSRQDGEMGLHYVSEKAEEIFGLQADIDGFFERFTELVVPEHRQAFLTSIQKAVETTTPWYFEGMLQKPTGEKIYFSGHSTPSVRETEIVFNGIILDITSRKKAEEMEQKLQAQLQQAQKMEAIGTLAGGIAHDFNNILSAIIGFTELSLDEAEKGTNLEDSLQEIYAAGKRAKDLARQILTISRRDEKDIKPLQVNALVQETLKMLRSTIPTSIDIQGNICSDSVIVNADATQLHQVIINLVTNAKQAMVEGSGTLEIGVDTIAFGSDERNKYPEMQPGNYAHITVSDTGSGILEKDIENIFEPYFTTKKKGEGTGLGLSIVHSIIKSHQGQITVCSEVGKGTTFHVYLPLFKTAKSDLPAKSAESLPIGTELILLVDDEPPLVKLQQQILERLGYKVVARTSSTDALEAFRASPAKFDLVITDMTMPYMTGDKLSKEIKAIRHDMPVILCTGFSEKINGHVEGMDIEALLMKPIDKTKMAKTVRKVIDEAKDKSKQ